MEGVDSEHIFALGTKAGLETREVFHRWKEGKVARRVWW
jgi:hypothetical protein